MREDTRDASRDDAEPPSRDGAWGVDFSSKDEPLRQDVRQLGALLGDVLRDQGTDRLLDRVESVRHAARRRRAGDATAERELIEQLAGTDCDETLDLVRAFSAYFGLVNLAERVHRVRRRRSYRAANQPQPNGLEAVFATCRKRGVDRDAMCDVLESIVIEPVFTAHPTEATRRTILVKELKLAETLVGTLQHEHSLANEEIRDAIQRETTVLWQTEEQLRVRPTVADEVEHTAFFVTEVLYPVVGRLRGHIRAAFDGAYPASTDTARTLAPHAPRIRFGSWVGGDMDGNPNVGSETIRATLARHAQLALDLHGEEIRELFRTLSQSATRIRVSEDVTSRIATYRDRMPEVDREIPSRYLDMPYRVLLWFMSARLERVREDRKQAYESPDELLEDLSTIRASLDENRGRHAGLDLVDRLMHRVETFGFHLMTLDTRQDALEYRRAVGDLLQDERFFDAPADERTSRLTRALAVEDPEIPPGIEDATRDTLDVFRALHQARRQYGPNATGLSIISMAQGPDDALTCLYLARRAGLVVTVDEQQIVPLDVTPLFETVDDLASASATLRTLLAHDEYRAHLRQRDDTQFVMLGYSDSNKDSGIGSSRWALQRAQRELVDLAHDAGIRVKFFHGRGGSISRGGSKPRRAVLALPEGALGGHLRLTEQGETIRLKYGLDEIAERSLELVVGAMLERESSDRDSRQADTTRHDIAQRLAEASRESYRTTVYDDPDFYGYFRTATPIDIIERLCIGSRPSSRRQQRGIEDLRAIPWVFSWMQSRHLLSGWLGIGHGIATCFDEFGRDALRATREEPFFGALWSDVEMVLAKADMCIARHYAALAGDTGIRIFDHLEREYERTRELVCDVLETRDLLEREPVLQRSIRLRNPYVDPMSFLQVELLDRWRGTEREDRDLERMLAATVQGIARGLRNTG